MVLPRRTLPRRVRAAALLSAAVLLASACGRLEPLSTREALERLNIASTKLFASDGSLIANLHGEIDRDIVKLSEIPEHVQNAVIAIEDQRFWIHKGIDLRSIVRAALSNTGSAASDDASVQGGSTISQQLVKNLYFPRPERTAARKVAEARVTWQFERQYEKPEILQMYLNTIYFGRGVYGIQAAARSYFRKPASQLTLAEAAFLAGVIHEPGRYVWDSEDPPQQREERRVASTKRRDIVLRRMVELDLVDADRARLAGAEPLQLADPTASRWNHPYFVDMVLRQLGVLRNSRSDTLDQRYAFLGSTFEERAGNVYRGGLRIYTTVDPKVQAAAEEAVAEVLPSDFGRISAAVTAVEPSTGYVRAVVGGRNYYPPCGSDDRTTECRLAKVNLALGDVGGGSGRQPGSSFKPFVLAAALERGISLNQRYSGAPFTHSYPGGVWNVRNYEGSGGGSTNLVDGTVHSVNAVYAHLEIDGVGGGNALAGASQVATLARRLGIGFESRDAIRARCGADYARRNDCLAADDTPSLALGAKEVSPFDMAAAYSTFANDGVHMQPTAIVRIEDNEGRVLYQARGSGDRVLPPGVARGVTHVLQQAVQRGTGVRAQIDRPAAGKTGTSQQWRDAWFAGYVPQLAAVVWVGNPLQQEDMVPSNGYPLRVVGGTYPAMIWRALMTRALRGIPELRFPPPPSAFFVTALGPEAETPNVLGLTADEAAAALTAAGFTVRRTQCPAGGVADGIVVQQAPGPGAMHNQGSAVEICIASDDILASPDPDAEVDEREDFPGVVPGVVGESRARARSNLSRAGYDVEAIEECDPSGGDDLARVWNQDPAGGTHAPPGTTVRVWYNPGGCASAD